MLAAAALLANGWEVFLNPTHFGVADLAASKDGVMHRIQVKTFYTHRAGARKTPQLSIEVRTSTAAGGEYHRPYTGLVDYIAGVDVESAEVFLVSIDDLDGRKVRIQKNVLARMGKLIYPL